VWTIAQESAAVAIDPERLLNDAEFQILAMIVDLVEFAYGQVSLLQPLACWCTEIHNRPPSLLAPVEAGIAGLVENSTLTARGERIDQQTKEKTARLGPIGTLRTDIVQFCDSKLSEIQHQMTLENIQIAQLSMAAPGVQSRPRRRTTISRPVNYGDEMSPAQRVILALQTQVTNLRARHSTATSTIEVALRAQEVHQPLSDGSMS
jgi:hypothetical protein